MFWVVVLLSLQLCVCIRSGGNSLQAESKQADANFLEVLAHEHYEDSKANVLYDYFQEQSAEAKTRASDQQPAEDKTVECKNDGVPPPPAAASQTYSYHNNHLRSTDASSSKKEC